MLCIGNVLFPALIPPFSPCIPLSLPFFLSLLHLLLQSNTYIALTLHTSSISHSINDPSSINDKDARRVTLTCAASSLYYKYTSQTYKKLYKHISNSLFLHLLLLIMYGITM